MSRTAIETTTVDLRTAGPCRTFRIPDSDRDVGLATLHHDPVTGATTALVRFPGGWSRPLPGHYLSHEDFVVLAGGLTIDGTTFDAGDWGYFAKGHCRGESHADPDGAVALAWFDRAPRWVSGGHHVPDRPAGHRSLLQRPPRDVDLDCPTSRGGQRLRRDPGVDLWLADGIEAGERLDRPCEILALPTWTWMLLPAGRPTPELAGPCVIRLENRL